MNNDSPGARFVGLVFTAAGLAGAFWIAQDMLGLGLGPAESLGVPVPFALGGSLILMAVGLGMAARGGASGWDHQAGFGPSDAQEPTFDTVSRTVVLERTSVVEGDALEQVLALANSGKKIEAIKRLREMTGMGLKDAKEAVEALTRKAA